MQISFCPSVCRSWSLSMHRSTDLRSSVEASSWWMLPDWHGNQHCDRLLYSFTSLHPTKKFMIDQWNSFGRGNEEFFGNQWQMFMAAQNKTTQRNHKSIFKKKKIPNFKSQIKQMIPWLVCWTLWAWISYGLIWNNWSFNFSTCLPFVETSHLEWQASKITTALALTSFSPKQEVLCGMIIFVTLHSLVCHSPPHYFLSNV